MATNDSDDLMPRPLPKPSQLQEISVRPEVPEVSLVFDFASGNPNKTNSPLTRQINNSHQQTTSLLDTNYFIPRLDHHSPSTSSSKSPIPVSPANTVTKTQCQLDDRGSPSAKKVSFSPYGPKTDTNGFLPNDVESLLRKNENAICRCAHETATGTQYHHSSKCACASCSNDSYDCTWDHSASIQRVLKNLERKINTKVSYDDLQKTELKIENILLKHKCKYDKLGENCVSKDEFNRTIKNYESQINLLHSRVEELTQKLSYSYSCNREMKKCSCADELVVRKNFPKQVHNAPQFPSGNCCPSHRIPNENFIEDGKNYVNGDAAMATHNHHQSNVQPIASDDHEFRQLKNCHPNCCHDQGNFKSVDHYDLRYGANLAMQNNVMIQTMNTNSPPEEYNQTPLSVYKSNANQIVTTHQHHSNQPQNVPCDYQPTLSEKNEEQLSNAEKNIRLDWAFYNNIVEGCVKNIMETNTKPSAPNADTIDLIKKATIEQLQKMGINVENRTQNEKHSSTNHQNTKFIPTNSAPSPDLSFRVNKVAMKYVSGTPPDVEYHNKKSPANENSFRSNCNNVSIATLQYMERYQLLPNSEQRYGGNSIGFTKHEQNVAQDRHKTHKPSQNIDRSFIY